MQKQSKISQISVDPMLSIRLGWIEMTGVAVTEALTAYDAMEYRAESYRKMYNNLSVGQVPGLEQARQLFHAIGIDPTKRRPSSEALLRRALKNKSLYSVNTLVDVCNWCSLDFLLPICLYDTDKIKGNACIRIGRQEDSYEALSHQILSLNGRYCLADDDGAFGSPITDSIRTSVTLKTTHVLFIVFAPKEYPKEKMIHHLDVSVQRIIDICGGNLVREEVI